jgi:hypothetical protein
MPGNSKILLPEASSRAAPVIVLPLPTRSGTSGSRGSRDQLQVGARRRAAEDGDDGRRLGRIGACRASSNISISTIPHPTPEKTGKRRFKRLWSFRPVPATAF